MASLFRIGSSRRKAEAPGKIRIQFKEKASEVSNDESDVMDEHADDDDDEHLPVTFGNNIPDDLPEGTVIVEPEAVEDSQMKRKRDAPVRIDTSVLDNVNCTACGRQLNPYKNGALQKHPELKVVICKNCEKFLSSGEISKDKDGADEQCRWCGEGGRLLVCDDCSSAFCKSCVMRNFSRSEFNNINDQDNWQCYLCNKASIKDLRENYRKIRDTLKALKEKEKNACSTSIDTQHSVRSAGSKQKSKVISSNSSTKGGKMSHISESNNCSNSASSTLISLEDLNVNSENVDATIDKLFTSTNTFTDVLKALRNQSQFSTTGVMNLQQKRQQHARALNKSMETYLKSLKTILTESLHTNGDEDKLTGTQNMNSAKLKAKEATPSSLSKIQSSSTKSNTVQKRVSGIVKVNSAANHEAELLQKRKTDLPKFGSAKKAECVTSINGDLSSEDVTSNSKSQKKNNKDSDAKRDTLQVALEKCTVSVTDVANISKTIKDNVKGSQKDIGISSEKKARKSVIDRNSKDENGVDNEESERSKSESLEENTNLSDVETSNHSTKNKTVSDKDANKVSEKKSRSDSFSEKTLVDDQIEIDSDLQKSPSDASHGLLSDGNKKEETSAVKSCSVYNDENLAAKLDLIKELADEVLRNGKDSDDEEDDDDLPVTFGGEVKTTSENNLKKVVPKRKKSHVSTDEDTTVSEKKSKVSNKKDTKKTPKKPADENSKKTSPNKPQRQVSADVGAASDVSSSDVLMTDEDDVDLSVRRQKKKSKNKRKTTEKNLETAKSKPTDESTDKDCEVEDIDKEIEKLSKLPTMRKRKAADMNEDEEVSEEKESVVSEVEQKTKKKSKPGPKCSKKGVDYDDLSSDENEDKGDDEDIDEDDEPPVTFFDNTVDTADLKEENIDENELAKNTLLEDMESDNDSSDGNENSSSTDEDSDAAKKTKKKEPKQSKGVKKEEDTDAEKEEDSDEDIGKRKKIKSKLLDAKLSDSDSDIGKPKKKKKDDDDSFKEDSSSDSSSGSDLSEEDSDDDSDNSESDDDEPKSKKKGKKKSNKKKKGKGKKGGDDESEDDSSEPEGKKNKKGKAKKRKRIKKMSNSSDDEDKKNEEDEDDDDPNSSKAGKRKQIRKVMSSKRLEDSTRAAAKAEEKRRKRIAAKQREFNIETITDDNNPMNCPVTTKLILDAGKEEGEEPLVQVNKKLVRKLKPHQVEAVQFMWDCLYESVKRTKKSEGAGCILAHCMGLGKTLSVVAFVHTVLTHEKVLKHRTCLVVSPLNTVLNWKNEWTLWLDEEDQLEVWELSGSKQNALRANDLKDWHESGGIMIIGYEMYRNLTTGNRCKNKKQKKIFYETLVDPGPDLVICDEGHILKNEASAISKSMNQMKTLRRVVLTGTPLQNNLNEYHCMVSFVKPNLLGTRKEFNNRFISPIQNGQCTDSTQGDFKLMKARAHVLHEMLAGCVQRRDYSALTKFLPPKQEYVISVRLTNIQIELYEKYMELTGQGVDGVFTNKGARLFKDYQNLMKIWTHPWVLKLAEIRDELKMKYDDDEESFIDDDDTEEEKSFSSSSSSSDDDQAMSDSAGEGTSAKPGAKRGTRRTRAKARRKAGEDSDPEEVIAEWKTKRTSNKDGDVDLAQIEETDKTVTRDWWAQYVTEDDKLKLELSNKLYLLFEILRMCEEIGDKVLIFSQSILSLNIIENFLEVIDTKFQQECDNLTEEEKEHQGAFGRSWTKNLDYYRMDGTTSAQNRQLWASNFNDPENYRTRLFLISTRAGGLGINLVAANRVIIFDASWNPSHDVQSIFRVYRFGQIKPCYIYRFLAQGTMEEKIYERQVAKLSLSQRVVDEHQIERHFSANDLKELYNFRPDRWDDGTEKPTLALPKDPLLAEILTGNRHCVVSFHEHDSLLENQVEQTLTEEEKKSAWEEYENEKKGIIKGGAGMDKSSWPMMAAAQILSREQITGIVQALRQQLPDISEDLFNLHLQQALKRHVQIKQEEMRRMELLRLQELNFLNMMKQQGQLGGMSRGQFNQNMTPWMQLQQLRAMQQNMMGASNMGAYPSAPPSSSKSKNRPSQKLNNPISNKPEEAIDLDDN